MEGWVDLGDLLHTEMIYPPTDGHPPKYQLGSISINYVDQSQYANRHLISSWISVLLSLALVLGFESHTSLD